MPTPVRQNTFQIEAEYLHLFVGRRVIIPVDTAGLPFRIVTVRHEPETGRVLVQIDTPMLHPLEVEFQPGDVVEVEHEAATL